VTSRGLTLALGGALAVGLGLGGLVTEVPYVALEPGPIYDTLGAYDDRGRPDPDGRDVIEIEGRQTYEPSGRLDLTTVSVTPKLTLGAAIWGWFSRDQAVLPRELIYPPDRSDEEVQEENQEQMAASRDTATAAALRELGLRSEVVTVSEVPQGPSSGVLQPGDVIVEVDGEAVLDGISLRQLIGTRRPGETVRIGFRRGSTQVREAVITTGAAPDDASRPVIGVVTNPTPVRDLNITINLKDVGGPSAGLMFALGIVDKLDRVDITGGKHIAGTGAIDADGTVQPIGGIAQKLVAAEAEGAEAFLVPAGNCDEALDAAPDDLVLIKAGTLREALVGLRDLRDGGTPTGC
jgi:Lon-like protease